MLRGVSELASQQKQKRGLNTSNDIFSLVLGESPAAQNVEWKFDGPIVKRLGHTSMNSVVLESSAGYGMFDCGIASVGIDTATKLLMHCDGSQYQTNIIEEMGKTVVSSASGTEAFLCHFNGENGATTYTSEIGNLAATFTGNARIVTDKFKFGGACLGCSSATHDFVTFPAGTTFNLANSNFTIEFWIYMNDTSKIQQYIFSHGNAPGNNMFLQWIGTYWDWYCYTGPFELQVTEKPPTKTWFHLALQRNGTNFTIYRDGSSLGSTNSTVNFPSYTGYFAIGGHASHANVSDFDGYIDEFHIFKSTSNGAVKYYQAFTPTTREVQVYNITDNKFGSAALDFQYSYAKVNSSSDFNFTGDFTIDFWTKILKTGTSDLGTFLGMRANSSNYWALSYTNNAIGFAWVDTGITKVNMSSPTLAWDSTQPYHVALVRNGSTFSIYRNGTSLVSTTTATTLNDQNVPIYIGAFASGTANYLDGAMDEIRLSNVARYTGAFTPASEAYGSNFIQARRLLCASGTGTYYSNDLGRTFTACQSSRSATRNHFSFVKNYILNTNDLYDRPSYWTGTAGTYFKAMTNAPLCKYALSHQGYLVMLNENSNKRGMYYISEDNMLTSSSFSNFQFPTERNDEITGGFVLRKFLYVSTKYKIFRLIFTGGNPDWTYTEVKSWGFVPETFKKVSIPGVGEVAVGLDYSKHIRIFDGSDDAIVSSNIELDNGMTEFYMNNVNAESLSRAWAENDTIKQVYKLYIGYGNSSNITHCVNYDYRNQTVYVDDNQTFNAGVLASDTADGAHLLGSKYNNFVYHMDSGNTDDGVPIDDYFSSHFISPASPTALTKLQQTQLFFSVTSSGNIFYEDRSQFSNQWNKRKEFTLNSNVGAVQTSQAIDIPANVNVYQFKVSSSANTADPWELNRISVISDTKGVGKP